MSRAPCRQTVSNYIRWAAITWALCLSSAAGAADVEARPAPPDLASQQRALKLVREIYRAEFASARNPEQKSALARRILQVGSDEHNDLSGRFALLLLAQTTAAEAGDVETAFAAIDELDQSFQLDAMKLKAEAAASAARISRRPAEKAALVPLLDRAIAQAIASDRYDVARAIADLSASAARGAEDASLLKAALGRAQQVREAERGWPEAKAALAALQNNPDDPQANLKLGSFRCFLQQNWEAGLPLLAMGSDPVLAKLAEADRAAPLTAEDQVQIADGWWQLAAKLSTAARASTQSRAAKWYESALPSLDRGLAREKVQRRLAEAAALARAAGPASGLQAGMMPLSWQNLPKYTALRLIPAWQKQPPRKILRSVVVKDALVLRRADSPYLVADFLRVEEAANLNVEPGVVLLFAPDARLENKGTLTLSSEGAWIVLACADGQQRWRGIANGGTIRAKRCLMCGADKAIACDRAKDLKASQCIFAFNGSAIHIGTHSRGTIDNCLLFRNGCAIGSEANGMAAFSRCLLAVNGKAFSADYNGGCTAERSTLFANEIGVESAIYDGRTELHECNILGNLKWQAITRHQGQINARRNFWGKDMADAVIKGKAAINQGKVDGFGALAEPVGDALPSLPQCDYVTY